MREPGERRGGLIVLFPFSFFFLHTVNGPRFSHGLDFVQMDRECASPLRLPFGSNIYTLVLSCSLLPRWKNAKSFVFWLPRKSTFRRRTKARVVFLVRETLFDPSRCWRIVLTSISTHDHAPSAIFPKRDGRSRTITFLRSRATWKEDRRKCVNGIGPAIYRTIVAKRSVEFRFVSVFPLIQARTFKCRNLPSSWKKEAWHNAYRLTGSGAEHERG